MAHLDDLRELRNGTSKISIQDNSSHNLLRSSSEKKQVSKFKLKEKEIEELEVQGWFFNETDKNAAEAILADCNEDTFLVRIENDKIWISSIAPDRKITHVSVEIEEMDRRHYFRIEGGHRSFENISEMINSSPELDHFTPFHRKRRKSILAKLPAVGRRSLNLTPDQKLEISDNSRENSPRMRGESEDSEEHLDGQVFTVREIQAEYKKVMEGNNEQQIAALKETVKAMIETYETRIQEFDRDLLQHSLNSNQTIPLSSDDNKVYLAYNQAINKLKSILSGLRLRGDEFLILHKGENKMFRVAQDGQIHFCTIKRTSNTADLAPPDMSEYCYFNVKVIESGRGTLYEVKSAKMSHYIDEVAKIATENIVVSPQMMKGGCVIYWKNGKKSSFITAIPEEVFELVEVVGTHLKSFNQSTMKQIQMIKDIHRCKSTQYSPESPQHLFLLERLWKSLSLEGQMEQVSKEWKKIGFQGTNPATDFRGMGLLGLLNLLYFAENYNEKVVEIIQSHRDYPWAASGINITNMLLNILNITPELVALHPSAPSWHTPLLSMFYHANNDDTFDELYSQSFLLFDQLWIHHNATYMDFPTIIAKLQRSVEELLNRRPTNVEQLCSWIEQRRKSFL